MEEVRGQLAVGILAEVLRHAAFLRETGRVDVSSERNRGWVVVRDGRPVHAVCRRPDGGPAHGLEALATMLSWSEGTYAFEVALSGPALDTGSLPADAFLDAEDDPRTLSGDAETVLKEARAYSGHRNGRLTDVRPRFGSVSMVATLAPVAGHAGNGALGERTEGAVTSFAPDASVATVRTASGAPGSGADDVAPSMPDPVVGSNGEASSRAQAPVFAQDHGTAQTPAPGQPLAPDQALASAPAPAQAQAPALPPAQAPVSAQDHGTVPAPAPGEPQGQAPAPVQAQDPAPSRLRGTSVLKRVDGGDPEARTTVSRGALELWRHLDGAKPLGAWSGELGLDSAVLERRADELVRAGLAVAEPEPMYGPAFVTGLTEALNEIMGPMGEIVVQDALSELDADPDSIPVDRVDALVSALVVHLHRSDWQLKLRARVSRLRVETMETRTEASP